MADVELKVGGMACDGCASTVKKAIATADPKASVTVDLAAKLVRIDSALDRNAAAAVIKKAGYDILG